MQKQNLRLKIKQVHNENNKRNDRRIEFKIFRIGEQNHTVCRSVPAACLFKLFDADDSVVCCCPDFFGCVCSDDVISFDAFCLFACICFSLRIHYFAAAS